MRSARSYQREIKRLRELVAEAQWVQPTFNGSPSCPWCGHQQHWNHNQFCPVPKELRSPMRVNSNGEWVLD